MRKIEITREIKLNAYGGLKRKGTVLEVSKTDAEYLVRKGFAKYAGNKKITETI